MSITLTFLTVDYKSIKNNIFISYIKNKYNKLTYPGLTEKELKNEIQQKKIKYTDLDEIYIHETYDIIDKFDEI